MRENDLELKVKEAEDIIHRKIHIIRGHKVMLDYDLAELYGVVTKVFNQVIKRNLERFPNDFMFKLSQDEFDAVNRSQIVTGSQKHRDPRFLPNAFTEHGVAMLSAVLNSKQAIRMSIFIVRAFIKMRESLDNYKDLEIKIGKIELKQKKDSDALYEVYSIVKQITEAPIKPSGKIGFNKGE